MSYPENWADWTLDQIAECTKAGTDDTTYRALWAAMVRDDSPMPETPDGSFGGPNQLSNAWQRLDQRTQDKVTHWAKFDPDCGSDRDTVPTEEESR